MTCDRKPMKPELATVLTIWQETLTEAQLSYDDAVSAAAMLLGLVCTNISPSRRVASAIAEEAFDDISVFIDENYDKIIEYREIVRSRLK